MHSAKYLRLFILGCLGLSACGPDRPVTPVEEETTATLIETLTAGNSKAWVIRAMTVNGSDQPLESCEQDARIEFRKTGEGSLSYSGNSCGTENTFTWEAKGDTLFILSPVENQKLLVFEKSNATLRYRINYDDILTYEFTLEAR
jgi:hypothetical protein